MMQRSQILSLAFVAVAACGKPSAGTGSVTQGNACSTPGDCAGGLVCYESICMAVCQDDSQCAPAESCADQVCQLLNHDCANDEDCQAPAECETTEGTFCRGGICHYGTLACQQVAPVDACRVRTGRCDPSIDGCWGPTCCVYDPLWPEGSGSAQPQCPFAGEDPDSDGTLDNGESWTGVCDHHGLCTGCTVVTQCDDGNECTADSCTADGVCEHDTTSGVGAACTVTALGDGVCTALGPGRIGCRLKQGSPCTSPDECSSAICAQGYCCNSACTGNCQRCDAHGAEGTCAPDSSRCTGNCSQCGLSGNCEAKSGACMGSCSACSGSGMTFNCVADSSACSGNCATCSGSDMTFDCAANNGTCTGNCAACTGAGNAFSCGANTAACSGNCNGGCQGSGTSYSCAANDSACSAVCTYCAVAGTVATCSPTPDGQIDAGICASPNVCDGSGHCGYPNGTACTADSQCTSAHCECIDATCANRLCNANQCVCKYGAGGACTTNLMALWDPEDCQSPNKCVNGSCTTPGSCSCGLCGNCTPGYGGLCSGTGVCGSCNSGFTPSGCSCSGNYGNCSASGTCSCY